MERVERIQNHPLFKENLKLLKKKRERKRKFCRHGIRHLTDVARIALYTRAEKRPGHTQRCGLWYARIHDIGRYRQYGIKRPITRRVISIA